MGKQQKRTLAFGYLRVSGKGQLKGDGFPRQRAAIEKFAASRGYEIARWYEERGVPGATEWESRPAWSTMVQNLNGVQTIIVAGLDRLARELFVQEYILRDLKQRHVTLLSANEEDIGSDPARVLFRQVMGAIAEYDKAMVVLKLRGARQRMKAKTGRCEGRKPFGSWPGEAATLEKMRSLRADGWTFTRIAELLNESSGVRTRDNARQKRWYPATVQKILARAVKAA
jgi:DNA invertase Pin-like site-specific DNA recombinase